MSYRGTFGLTHVSVADRRRGPPSGMGKRRGVRTSKWQRRRAIGRSQELSLGWEGYSKALVAAMQLLERWLAIEGILKLVCRKAASSGVPRFKSCCKEDNEKSREVGICCCPPLRTSGREGSGARFGTPGKCCWAVGWTTPEASCSRSLRLPVFAPR